MEELSICQHIVRSIKYGEWSCGFATKKEWPTKERFSISAMYYDGWHWALHIGCFYISASFY